MTPYVTDTAHRIVSSPFGDALSRGVDWVVVIVVLVLLIEHEYVRHTSRTEGWKRSRLAWMYGGPLVIAFVALFAQRMFNLR